jgi:hypothetical protein
MAKVKIQGHASGTGILTVTAPNTSTDRTITLPDATGTLLASEGAVTINDSGADVDFRVESDTNANSLFLDGANGKVGFGTATPDCVIDIEDTLQATANQHYSLVVGGGSGSDSVGNSSSILLSTTQGVTRGSSISAEKANVGNGHNLIFATSASTATPAESLRLTTDGRGLSQFTAKAWAQFNMTGTPAFNDSHNFSSLSDHATGYAQCYFTNAMANANYSAVASGSAESWGNGASTQCNVAYTNRVGVYHIEDGSTVDTTLQSVLVFGD